MLYTDVHNHSFVISNLPNRITISKLQSFKLNIIVVCVLEFAQTLVVLFEFTDVEMKEVER